MRAATFVVLCALLGCVAARGVSRSCLPAFVWKPERPWVASGTRRLRPTAPAGGRAAACSRARRRRPPPHLCTLRPCQQDRHPWKGWKNPCRDQPDGINVATGGCSNEFVPVSSGAPARLLW